jgi:hypothetical protein
MAENEMAPVSFNIGERFYKDGALIPADDIINRIRGSFAKIDAASAEAMFDLFFLHQNWKEYKRKDSFRKFIKEELNISKSYAYGIIKAAKCFKEYFERHERELAGIDSFLGTIQQSLETVGIRKLLLITSVPASERKESLLRKVFNREEIAESELETKKPIETRAAAKEVGVNDNVLSIDGRALLTFTSDAPQELREALVSWLKRYRGKPKAQ